MWNVTYSEKNHIISIMRLIIVLSGNKSAQAAVRMRFSLTAASSYSVLKRGRTGAFDTKKRRNVKGLLNLCYFTGVCAAAGLSSER